MKADLRSFFHNRKIFEFFAILIAIFGCWIFFSTQIDRSEISGPRTFEMGLIYWPPYGVDTPDELAQMEAGLVLENSEHILVQVPFSPHSVSAFNNAKWMSELATNHGRKLTISIDWMSEDRNSLLNAENDPWTFQNTEVRDRYLKEISALVTTYQPDYLLLGVEVDFLARINLDEFRYFVTLYEQAYFQSKKASPSTSVTVTFQFESLRGMLGGESSILNSPVVTAFGPLLDIFGLSVYPCQLVSNPDTLPIDYFSSSVPGNIPTAIFETAWPSLGQDESEQAAYLNWLFGISNTIDVDLLVWASAIDSENQREVRETLNPQPPCSNPVSEWSGRIGLWQITGKPKLALKFWQTWLTSGRTIKTREAATKDPKDPEATLRY